MGLGVVGLVTHHDPHRPVVAVGLAVHPVGGVRRLPNGRRSCRRSSLATLPAWRPGAAGWRTGCRRRSAARPSRRDRCHRAGTLGTSNRHARTLQTVELAHRATDGSLRCAHGRRLPRRTDRANGPKYSVNRSRSSSLTGWSGKTNTWWSSQAARIAATSSPDSGLVRSTPVTPRMPARWEDFDCHAQLFASQLSLSDAWARRSSAARFGVPAHGSPITEPGTRPASAAAAIERHKRTSRRRGSTLRIRTRGEVSTNRSPPTSRTRGTRP